MFKFFVLFIFPFILFAKDLSPDAKIYVAGHRGLVGSAIVRKLEQEGFTNIITRTSKELDLRNQAAVLNFFNLEKPDYVFLIAAKVGGIGGNSKYPADFIYDNVMIEFNVINASYLSDVTKLLFLGSSCIYPRDCPQPIKEEYLLSGPLEKTNKAYAIAKIAGLELCDAYNKQHGTNFISCMPTNLYGPGDNFDLFNSHVLPAFIAKFTKAKNENLPSVALWGTGTPKREFLHVDDMADAAYFLMLNYDGGEIINVGCGKDISIKRLAEIIKQEVGYEGELNFDPNMPNGTPRKVLNTSKINALGWYPKISLKEGISDTVRWYKENY